jgi:prevent-host-death family protein
MEICTRYIIVVQVHEGESMKTYPMNQARAQFSKLVEGALAGEPQRVTRYGKEAVVIVSEGEWLARGGRSAPTLGALIARHARAGTLDADIVDRPWSKRRLGADVD